MYEGIIMTLTCLIWSTSLDVINAKDIPLLEFMYTLYLHAGWVTTGDSGLCCCVCFKYWLIPLCVDSARVLWVSDCNIYRLKKTLKKTKDLSCFLWASRQSQGNVAGQSPSGSQCPVHWSPSAAHTGATLSDPRPEQADSCFDSENRHKSSHLTRQQLYICDHFQNVSRPDAYWLTGRKTPSNLLTYPNVTRLIMFCDESTGSDTQWFVLCASLSSH